MASVHRKSSNGTWYIRYRLDGKQKHKSLGTRSHRQALKLKRELELLLEERGRAELVVTERPPDEAKNPQANAFWDVFSQWAVANRAASTVDEYRLWFNQFRDFAGIRSLGDATRIHAEAFKAKLLRQGERKPKGVGLDKVSINNALKTLKSIWNHARKLGLYTGDNPFSDVEPFRIAQPARNGYLDGSQIESLLNAADRYADEKYVKDVEARNVRVAIALMALAGLRKKEVCFARWEWVDWETKILAVTNHDAFTTKNKKARVISMHESLTAILRPLRREEGYILETTRQNESRFRYRADFKKSFKRVCEIAGIRATPHELRHSFASRHAVRGRSLHVIAGWLGHSTTWVTERYAHYQMGYDPNVNDM